MSLQPPEPGAGGAPVDLSTSWAAIGIDPVERYLKDDAATGSQQQAQAASSTKGRRAGGGTEDLGASLAAGGGAHDAGFGAQGGEEGGGSDACPSDSTFVAPPAAQLTLCGRRVSRHTLVGKAALLAGALLVLALLYVVFRFRVRPAARSRGPGRRVALQVTSITRRTDP